MNGAPTAELTKHELKEACAAASLRISAIANPARDAESLLLDPLDATDDAGTTGCDLEVRVLGSGACNPSPFRSASAISLRVNNGYWLFDVGEGTQVQLQRCNVRPSRIDRIFVTHAHGDHSFGLPGLLCLIARGRDPEAPPLEVYGPAGLRAFVRVTLRFSGTVMLPRFVVHELHDIPYLHGRRPPPQPLSADAGGLPESRFGEQPGGLNIRPQPDGSWDLFTVAFGDGGELRVRAGPVRHSAPTVGYVVEEAPKKGRLRPELVMPRLEANRDALRAEWGVRDPRTLMKRVKALAPDEILELPDGSAIRGSEVMGDERRGRKVVVLGDTCDASPCEDIARGADLLIHEATNAYMPQYGDRGGEARFTSEVIAKGHSTPRMAGLTAAAWGARALLLTHFSQRYHPGATRAMRIIHEMAVQASGLEPARVVTAYDSLTLPIWQSDREKPLLPNCIGMEGERMEECAS